MTAGAAARTSRNGSGRISIVYSHDSRSLSARPRGWAYAFHRVCPNQGGAETAETCVISAEIFRLKIGEKGVIRDFSDIEVVFYITRNRSFRSKNRHSIPAESESIGGIAPMLRFSRIRGGTVSGGGRAYRASIDDQFMGSNSRSASMMMPMF